MTLPTATGGGNTTSPGTPGAGKFSPTEFFSQIFGNAISLASETYAAKERAKAEARYAAAKAEQTQAQVGLDFRTLGVVGAYVVAAIALVLIVVMLLRKF